MRWNWADHAFTNMFRIENWPDTMTADKQYPGKNFSQNGFTRTQLRQDILPAMEKALGNPEYANDDKVSDKWLRVVGWTEGTWWTPLTRPLLNSCLEEQELSPDEQGDIPLVVTVTGKVLLKLLDSAKFIKQTKPKQKAKRGAAEQRLRSRTQKARQSRPHAQNRHLAQSLLGLETHRRGLHSRSAIRPARSLRRPAANASAIPHRAPEMR